MNFDAKQYWKYRSKSCPYIEEDVKMCYTGPGKACNGCRWNKNKKENDDRVNIKEETT